MSWSFRVTNVATKTQQWVIYITVTLQAAVNNIYFENGTDVTSNIDKLLSLAYLVRCSAYTFSVTDHMTFRQII
jgi:hypothetical protein